MISGSRWDSAVAPSEPTLQAFASASVCSPRKGKSMEAVRQIPVHVRRDRTLWAKVIDACGLTCTFCHNEGTPVRADQRGVQRGLAYRAAGSSGRVSLYVPTNGVRFLPAAMCPDANFSVALGRVGRALGLDELHLTGGEPTLHNQLPDLIRVARAQGFVVAITSNGENGGKVLAKCAQAGLDRVNFSVFGTTPQELAQVQHRRFQSSEPQACCRKTERVARISAPLPSARRQGERERRCAGLRPSGAGASAA